MRVYRFSKSSAARLDTCHPDLRKIVREALKNSPQDFGVAEGYRSPEKQLEYYRAGMSKLDGISRKSKHNKTPSEAVDLFASVGGAALWEARKLSFLAGVVISTARDLHRGGQVEHLIRWGGNWDGDGEIITDQDFDDLPHFELYKPKDVR